MAYSLRITQKTAIARVMWFIKQNDAYNALEALKDVESEDSRSVLDYHISKLKSDYRKIN
jgi:hypothetical protein